MTKFTKNLAEEYAKLWDQAKLVAAHQSKVAAVVQKINALKPEYVVVSHATGVPWYVVGLIHNLECSLSMQKHLHNGDLLTAKTRREPPGHPKSGSPPFKWTDSAIDALKLKGMHTVEAWSVERIAFELEIYNGWGYRRFHPEVLTPYLWSFTDRYTKGKYVRDGVFDPAKPSDQVGAMAALKQFVKDGLSIPRQSGVAATPPPPPVPVPTGFFVVDGDPFGLREQPRDDATKIMVVQDLTIAKIAAVDDTWWEVEVTAPDGSKEKGFAKKAWLKEQTVLSTFNEEEFAETCLSEARVHGTSAHFLIALAFAERGGLLNTPGDAGRFGPFLMDAADWAKYNNPAVTGYGPGDISKPQAQAAVAAIMTAKLTEEARAVLPDKKLPTAEELYLVRIFGAAALQGLLANPQDRDVRAALAPMPAAEIDRVFASRPALLTQAIKIDALRTEIRRRLDAGFEKAVEVILRVEPDLIVGPSEASGDATDVPWMAKAKIELEKPVKELTGGASNPEIEKYFEATPLGKQPDDVAWCAAFISWCIKAAGGSQKPVNFSARAADWLKNGEGLNGPQFGAVAVTRPLAKGASGHVGFVVSWDGTNVKLLGGNQGNSVNEQNFRIADVRGWRMM